MPSFYVFDQRIYYAYDFGEDTRTNLMIGAGYLQGDESQIEIALFLRSRALEVKILPDDDADKRRGEDTPNMQRFLGFAKMYASRAPMAIITAMWSDCKLKNAFDVLHALDPTRVGHLCLFVQPSFHKPPWKSLLQGPFNFISVALPVSTPGRDASCSNPFYKATPRDVEFNLATIVSAMCFDPDDPTLLESHVQLSKHHPTLVAIAAAIKNNLKSLNMTAFSKLPFVTKTQFSGPKGEYVLATIGDLAAEAQVRGGQNCVVHLAFVTDKNTMYPSEAAITNLLLAQFDTEMHKVVVIQVDTASLLIDSFNLYKTSLTATPSILFEHAFDLQHNIAFFDSDIFVCLDDTDVRETVIEAIDEETSVADRVEQLLQVEQSFSNHCWDVYRGGTICIKSETYIDNEAPDLNDTIDEFLIRTEVPFKHCKVFIQDSRIPSLDAVQDADLTARRPNFTTEDILRFVRELERNRHTPEACRMSQ